MAIIVDEQVTYGFEFIIKGIDEVYWGSDEHKGTCFVKAANSNTYVFVEDRANSITLDIDFLEWADGINLEYNEYLRKSNTSIYDKIILFEFDSKDLETLFLLLYTKYIFYIDKELDYLENSETIEVSSGKKSTVK